MRSTYDMRTMGTAAVAGLVVGGLPFGGLAFLLLELGVIVEEGTAMFVLGSIACVLAVIGAAVAAKKSNYIVDPENNIVSFPMTVITIIPFIKSSISITEIEDIGFDADFNTSGQGKDAKETVTYILNVMGSFGSKKMKFGSKTNRQTVLNNIQWGINSKRGS